MLPALFLLNPVIFLKLVSEEFHDFTYSDRNEIFKLKLHARSQETNSATTQEKKKKNQKQNQTKKCKLATGGLSTWEFDLHQNLEE